MDEFIPLSVPNLRGNERKYVDDAVDREWVSTGGEYIKQFEARFAEYAGVGEAVACQSGTAAIHLALIVGGVGRGDLVIAPALTFIASVNPIRYVGADPVFMDCDDSLCMDPIKLERYLAEECERRGGVLHDKKLGRPVKALLIVHVFGNLADMERIAQLAKRYGLLLVEDAAEAVGSFYETGEYAGRMAGTIGDIGLYSFNGNKIITTGGGGMIVSRDKAMLARSRHLSTQAKVDEVYFVHDEVGFNYRLTNLQAAVGVAQLEQLERFVEVKKRNYLRYRELGVTLLPFREGIRPNYWFYCHQTRDRDGLIKYLHEKRIQSRPIWALNHTLPMYRDCRAYAIETASAYHATVVNIPCSSNLTSEGVERVAKEVKTFDASRECGCRVSK